MAVVDLIVGDVPRFDVAKSHVELISARPPSCVVELHLRVLYVQRLQRLRILDVAENLQARILSGEIASQGALDLLAPVLSLYLGS